MLRVSKLFTFTTRIGFALVAVVLAGSFTHVQAALTCGNTIVLPGGIGTEPNSALTPGTCVQSTDKLYGNFDLAALPTGSVNFAVNPVTGDHSIAFLNQFVTATPFSYEVATVGANDFITQLSADILQTMSTTPSILSQLPDVSPSVAPLAINVLQLGGDHQPGSADVLTWNSGVADDILLTNSFIPGAGSDALGVENTFVENTPEPAMLELLGIALIGIATLGVRRKSRL